MIDFIPPKLIAVLQLMMAAGMIRFWFAWFGTEHKESWLPVGYKEHERVFVYPDSLLSILMTVSGVLIFNKNPLGPDLSLVCGGMMLFLLVIDLAYFYQHSMFRKDRNGKENLCLIISMGVMSFLMIFRFI